MSPRAEEQPHQYEEWREREKNYLEYLQEVTSFPLLQQERVLYHILGTNADTEYLRKYELNGATDTGSFRKHLPVSDYDDYESYVDRIFAGDKSPLLAADPFVEFLTSSGTSGGQPKLFPIVAEDLQLRGLVWSLTRPILNRALPGLDKGKAMYFYFMRKACLSPGGLPCNTAVTSFIKSSAFKDRPFDPSYRLTSVDEVIEAVDDGEAMYCHLLLGLLQRQEVVRFGAIFASLILKAMRCLESMWREISDDICTGTLSSRVKDETVRSAVSPLLRKDPELAEFLRNEFSTRKSSDGIIRKLWPNVKVIDTVCTGTMEAYLPALSNISGHLPIICTQLYAATEGYFGINTNPLCPPEEVYYTLIPSIAYYEFIAVSADSPHKSDRKLDEILDLVSLKQGQEYEILVTTISGLYRYRMGDVLKVVGFYNATPVFQFMRRRNVVLSIDTDKTDEKELHTAVTQGAKVLEAELGLRLHDYTSTADTSSKPGHYVIFWELAAGAAGATERVLEQCCSAIESTLSYIYRRERNERLIGPLELRVVEEGTFDLLANHAISRGATISQYKTPRGIHPSKTPALLDILTDRILRTAVSPDVPHFSPEKVRSDNLEEPLV